MWMVEAMAWKLVGGAGEPSKERETGKPRGPRWVFISLRELFKITEDFGTHTEFGLWRKKK